MPWTPAQHRLFEAAAHNPQIAQQRGMAQGKAQQMAAEGIKRPASAKAQVLAKVLSQTKPQV